MQGKRVLITGGNSGIGLVAAADLASKGAEVVLAPTSGLRGSTLRQWSWRICKAFAAWLNNS